MKRKTAYNIAIDSIRRAQKPYTPGHYAYLSVKGVFLFAKRDHKKWEKLETAIKILEKELADA